MNNLKNTESCPESFAVFFREKQNSKHEKKKKKKKIINNIQNELSCTYFILLSTTYFSLIPNKS